MLRAADVRAIHEALSRLSDDQLRARYDGPRMPELDAISEDDPWEIEYLMQGVAALRDGARSATERDMGWLMCMQ